MDSDYVYIGIFNHMLAVYQEHGVDEVTVRDQRYDAIYHLVTAADGADAFYKLAANRNETVENAVKV